jgi:hypothetical protein
MAIANRDDPGSNRTVYDMYNDREIVLSEKEIELIRRIQAGNDSQQLSFCHFLSFLLLQRS